MMMKTVLCHSVCMWQVLAKLLLNEITQGDLVNSIQMIFVFVK